MTITSDELITGVKRLITMPANQALDLDSDILAIATDRMRDTMIPLIDSMDQDYFVMKTTVPILLGVENYQIPPRAIGRKLREVKIFNENGVRGDFPKISIEREHLYRSSSVPTGFHFYGDRIQLVPIPQADGYSLQLWWFLSPGKLVPVSQAGLVSAVAADDVTIANVPASFTVGRRVDFVQGVTGNRYLGIDAKITNIAAGTLSFDVGTVPLDLAEGDYVSLAGESPVLQIPEEAMPYLQTCTAYDLLYAVSDFEGQSRLEKKMTQQREDLLKLLQPRITGEPNIIMNDRGLLRGRVRRNYGFMWRG